MIIKKKGTPITPAGGPSTPSGDWEDAPSENIKRRCHISIVGETGTGKTTLALTGPGPVALVNSDEKIEGIVQPFVKGEHVTCAGTPKRIRLLNFAFVASDSEEDTAQRAQTLWQKVRRNILESPGWANTTIVDTETETWELARLGYFGTLKPSGRTDNLYGPVNNDYRTLFKSFRLQDKCYIITIHHTKDEYVDKVVNGKQTSTRTGRQLRAGFKEMSTMPDIILRTGKRIGAEGIEFTAEIEKGWYNAQSEGLVFSGEDLRLSFILETITGVPEAEWL